MNKLHVYGKLHLPICNAAGFCSICHISFLMPDYTSLLNDCLQRILGNYLRKKRMYSSFTYLYYKSYPPWWRHLIFLTLGLTQGKNICLSEAFLWARASAAAQMGPSQKQAALNLASTQKREQGQADIGK